MILIAAMTRDRVIGKDNGIPWHIPEEFAHFKRTTTGHTLLMGRKTFESLGGRPLPRRRTVVVSRTLPENTPGVDVCRSFDEALEKAETYSGEIFVAGGTEIYRRALPLADRLYLSYIKKDYEGDTCFPEFDENEWEVENREDHADFVFIAYKRKTPLCSGDSPCQTT